MKKQYLFRRPNVVSLFSGWGGGDLGFHQALYETLLAVDFDKHSRKCFKLNFPGVDVQGWDISKLTGNLLLQYLGMMALTIDVLLMSPSCQGISLAGLLDPFDERNLLFLKSIRNIIPQAQPKTFIIENVDNLLHGSMRVFYSMVIEELNKLTDYVYEVRVLNALHYNTPQSRNRVIIMGVHKSLALAPSYPEPNMAGVTNLTIEKVLPEIDGLLYGYGFDKLKGKDEFANTITKTCNLRAYVNNEKVKLTIPQILKLAGYPPDWKYTGGYNDVWARVGNSIMPPLAYALAMHMNSAYFNQGIVETKLVA
jgi:DNA (cytosine-5)-methyltransferase 1